MQTLVFNDFQSISKVRLQSFAVLTKFQRDRGSRSFDGYPAAYARGRRKRMHNG